MQVGAGKGKKGGKYLGGLCPGLVDEVGYYLININYVLFQLLKASSQCERSET